MDIKLRILKRAAADGDADAQKRYIAALERVVGGEPSVELSFDEIYDLQQQLLKEVHEYFGYVEDWKVIPMDDQRDQYWFVEQREDGGGRYSHSPEPYTRDSIVAGTTMYGGPIYTQRFLPKWVYRGEKHTLVSADTQTDGNKFLMVFDNSKELKDQELKDLYMECWG